ncbi:hypothetical protein AGABI1DRAFT_124630 [Agaricus bisporus var. burnettii JB137-S8]|uniref:C2H2-type domain-containing protein n=1 Tax=Agaricus bisporus var. burnettii (strain JB137-S8 / ATCC MYA-4627 / FGSC 10392) TaxID=597362 RepID=K5XL65_AGABU|nr:uncharacterized protein AGABI1DRAFT_124630 [Agaricus bisporus var. burnettii JB137-S8]EKM84308.1 hypothetical protein AGABI1DRAFT_124630 [Agaricus bisporus var. burnettii JB137-S8]
MPSHAPDDLFSRPRTRSQTGPTTTTKRNRIPSDSVRLSASRKKLRPASESSSPPDNVPRRLRTESPIPPSTDVSQSTTRSSSPLVSTPPLTFLESSASPGYAPERRGPRARATLPVPVPNLTKKSRGRRVPTQEVAEVQGEPTRDKRTYVCKVEGCGKCFHRGEHLKRHIRSIHTHEKPFKCTYPSCGKFFNRHDNLLQHLKVHKQNSLEESNNPRPILNLSPPSPSPSPEPEPAMDHQLEESSASESEQVSPTIPIKPKYPVSYSPYTRFDIPCESYNLTSMMAISSLRTELPSHSLPTSRIRDSF